MGSGRLPFVSPRDGQTSSDERRRRLMAQINRGLTEVQERIIINLSPEFKSLLGRLLTPAPHKRITISELMHHPWLTKRSSLRSCSFRNNSTNTIQTDHNLVIKSFYKFLIYFYEDWFNFTHIIFIWQLKLSLKEIFSTLKWS